MLSLYDGVMSAHYFHSIIPTLFMSGGTTHYYMIGLSKITSYKYIGIHTFLKIMEKHQASP